MGKGLAISGMGVQVTASGGLNKEGVFVKGGSGASGSGGGPGVLDAGARNNKGERLKKRESNSVMVARWEAEMDMVMVMKSQRRGLGHKEAAMEMSRRR